MGTIPVRRDHSFKKTPLKARVSNSDKLFLLVYWTLKRLQNAKIASLKNSLHKDTENFEKQDHKQKSTRLLTLQLQGQRPGLYLDLLPHPFLGVHHWNTGPGLSIPAVINWAMGKQTVLKGPVQTCQHQLECPHSYPQGRAPIWAPPGVERLHGILQ